MRILVDALASGNLISILRRVRVDCDRRLGDLTTEFAGQLLSRPLWAAVSESVDQSEGRTIGQLVPVHVRA